MEVGSWQCQPMRSEVEDFEDLVVYCLSKVTLILNIQYQGSDDVKIELLRLKSRTT